jgi:subtilisin-like proprotein convertase family protein
MRTRSLVCWTAALALLVLIAAAVGADAQRPAAGNSPHLFSVPAAGAPAAALRRSRARVVARYGGFTLVRASGADADRLRRAGADLRDDMHRVRLGRTELDPATDRPALATKGRAPAAHTLAVVQFAGPIKDAWLDRLRATGVRVVSYMAENAYLVSGTFDQLAEVSGLTGSDPAFRALVSLRPDDKLGAGVKENGRQRFAIQTLSGAVGTDARDEVASVGDTVRATSSLGPYRTQYATLDAADARALAGDPGVVSVQPAPAPKLMDEVQDQILGGALSGPDPLVPTGPGYLALYNSIGLGTGTFPFVVDVTDSGFDTGSAAAGSQPDFHEGGVLANPTRVSYSANFTADTDAQDCIGHGTINASIIGGFNDGSGASVEDSNFYNYGLGVAPRAQVGASKIFRCSGSFGLTSTLSAVQSSAYAQGARIANHSWGANSGGAYGADAQTFDSLVRDAQAGTAGNQELVEVASAGNAGPGGNTIGSLAAAKNVIAVGASEGVRPDGTTDGCGVDNAGSDDAHDMSGFSSRGPTDDLRTKPDIVAPGTKITGAQSHATGYNGTGVCDTQFPASSILYDRSSGTSHSAPAIAGMAAIFRQWSIQNRGGATPSPALTKAALANAATDIGTGNGSGGGAPNPSQGWGLANLQRLVGAGPRFLYDQQTTFAATGNTFTRTFHVQDPSKPVRVTLAWTDPPGPTVGNNFVNDLDLDVVSGAGTFKGNVFSNGESVTGGTADPRNNLEGVYLPAGASGNVGVDVTAANIAGDGVPGNGDSTDQDFALVVSNATEVLQPVLTDQGNTLSAVGGDSDSVIEPGERFQVTQSLGNSGNANATGVQGALTGSSPVTITDGAAAWPTIAPGADAPNGDSLMGRVDPDATCGVPTTVTLDITSTEGAALSRPITITPGTGDYSPNSTDVPHAIPDNDATGVSSTLDVAGAGTIQDLNVRIGSITHTWVGDLKIQLKSPTGTIVVLADRPGGMGNGGDNFTNTVFDDEASTTLGAAGTAAPYTGSFKPQNAGGPQAHLSSFDAQSMTGTWTLTVFDLASADTGSLQSWGLDMPVSTCDFVPPPAPAQPTGLTLTEGGGSVALDWADTPTATSYEIYRRTSAGSYPANPAGTSGSSSFSDSPPAGQSYCYEVGALNDASPGPLSEERCTGGGTPPGGEPGGTPGSPPGGEPPGGTGPSGGTPIVIDLASLAKSVTVSKKGVFTLSFGGPAGQVGSIKLTTVRAVASAKRKLVVAKKSFTIPATGKVKLKLKLTRKGMRVLKRLKRLPVSAKVTLGTTTAAKRLTLRAPRARR